MCSLCLLQALEAILKVYLVSPSLIWSEQRRSFCVRVDATLRPETLPCQQVYV